MNKLEPVEMFKGFFLPVIAIKTFLAKYDGLGLLLPQDISCMVGGTLFKGKISQIKAYSTIIDRDFAHRNIPSRGTFISPDRKTIHFVVDAVTENDNGHSRRILQVLLKSDRALSLPFYHEGYLEIGRDGVLLLNVQKTLKLNAALAAERGE